MFRLLGGLPLILSGCKDNRKLITRHEFYDVDKTKGATSKKLGRHSTWGTSPCTKIKAYDIMGRELKFHYRTEDQEKKLSHLWINGVPVKEPDSQIKKHSYRLLYEQALEILENSN